MIKTILHLFKIHRKVVLGNAAVVVQDMLCETPESLNAVDVVFGLPIDERLHVTHCVMLAQPLERVVASEGIGIVDRAFASLLPYDRHQFVFRYMLNHPRVDPAIPLEKAEDNGFSPRSATSLSFAPATKVRLVHLDVTRKFFALKFGDMVDRFTEFLVHARDCLVVEIQVMRQTIRRLLFVEATYDGNFFARLLQRLLLSATLVPASYIPPLCLANLERSTKYTLLPSQKVGRAPKYVLFPLCHMDILVPYGYESH